MSVIFMRPMFPFFDRRRWAKRRSAALKASAAFLAGGACVAVFLNWPADGFNSGRLAATAPAVGKQAAPSKPAKTAVRTEQAAPSRTDAPPTAPAMPSAINSARVETTGAAPDQAMTPLADPSVQVQVPAARSRSAAVRAETTPTRPKPDDVAIKPADPEPVSTSARQADDPPAKPERKAVKKRTQTAARPSPRSQVAQGRPNYDRNVADGFDLHRAYRLPDGRRVTVYRRYEALAAYRRYDDGQALAYGRSYPRRMLSSPAFLDDDGAY